MITVFSHPGRRVGQLIEALTLALAGGFLGIAYSLLGLYLSSLLMVSNTEAAYALRGIFLAIALMLHGFYRSHAPRIFLFVLLFIIEAVTTLVTSSEFVTVQLVKQLVYPILLAGAVIFLSNILIFPEFSSAFLGKATINALEDVSLAFAKAGNYFVGRTNIGSSPQIESSPGHNRKASGDLRGPNSTQQLVKLADVVAMKSLIRKALTSCRNAQNESQYEVAYSHVPPHSLSPISKKAMKKLVTHTIAVIGACETSYALLGEAAPQDAGVKDTKQRGSNRIAQSINGRVDLDTLKPHREIEFGDIRLLRYLLGKIRYPYVDFQTSISNCVTVVMTCLAYACDVPDLPSKSQMPRCIAPEEIDIHHQALQAAISSFDSDTTAALEGAVMLQELGKEDLDIMPREEIFLVASFILNVRQAAVQVSRSDINF